jgi:uncharacterized membrane protein required for colicin V production
MKFDPGSLVWVDFVTAIVLFVGIIRGRKRGMSEELLDTLQWIGIVVVGGLYYEALAQACSLGPWMRPVWANLAGYLIIALSFKLVFSFVKRRLGEKIIGSDMFGRLEYYLGMVAGMVRFGCIYIFLLSFLHAPYYSAQDLVDSEKYQERWFSDVRLPTFGTLQHTFFKESFSGWAAENYLTNVLVKSVPGTATELRGKNSIAKRREAGIDDLMGRK